MLRREIDAAVYLFFEGNNIAARVLAWASLDVLRVLMQRAGVEGFQSRLEDHVRPEFVGQWRNLLRDHYNYFKHADRDPDRELDDYRPAGTAFNLLGAIVDYGSLYRAHTLPMATFKAWAFVRYPQVLSDEAPFEVGDMRRLVRDADNQSFARSLLFARDQLRLFASHRDQLMGQLRDGVFQAFEDL